MLRQRKKIADDGENGRTAMTKAKTTSSLPMSLPVRQFLSSAAIFSFFMFLFCLFY